jgi:hypothetical protein
MATRTIVTSQPDVACDVCERRLLRGEQPDIFLAAGRRRTVCELCAPRAAHEGWMRERDSQSVTLPPMRARRGRSFFERLRQKGISGGGAPAAQAGEASRSAPQAGSEGQLPGGYDFLEGSRRPSRAITSASTAAPVPAFPPIDGESMEGASEVHPEVPLDPAMELLVRGLELFNSSEYPRRVAGVSRSLGAPEVNVRSAEHLASVVVIVVAWELSWYRYEVDLSEDLPQVVAVAQGTELSELEREERVGNAAPSDSGALSLALPEH